MRRAILNFGVLRVVLCAFIVATMYGCKGSSESSVSNEEAFMGIVAARSNNVISKTDKIVVKFTTDFAAKITDRKTDVFDISPSIDGKTQWSDDNTLEFIPSEPLSSGQKYSVKVDIQALCPTIDDELATFWFKVRSKVQNLILTVEDIAVADAETFASYDVTCRIRLNDAESDDDVRKCVSANIDGKDLTCEIEPTSTNEYSMTIRGIERAQKEQKLEIKSNGKPIGVSSDDVITLPIPAMDEFTIIAVGTKQLPEQYVNVIFSDPISESQYLNGLLQLSLWKDVKYLITNNSVKIIPSEPRQGNCDLLISKTVKNANNKALGKNIRKALYFTNFKPELQKVSEGSIVTNNKNSRVISFTAVNIKAVDVQVTKIYSNNILQYLQDNNLGDSYCYDLHEVGKVIARKTVDLTETDATNFDAVNIFHIDLNNIVAMDLGAIYKVDVGFRMENCVVGNKDEAADNVTTLEQDNFWDKFNSYTYYPDDFQFDDNYDPSNPLDPTYYGFKKALTFDILSTDIGLTAKYGTDNKLIVYATDIVSTSPIGGLDLEVYNYQQQSIGSGQSDNDGRAEFVIPNDEEPFVVVATRGKEKSYLKCTSYSALSTSEFDVQGDKTSQASNNAFIFTDRGVWRPGDTVFIGLIINEKNKPLPQNIPIILSVSNPNGQEVFRTIQQKNKLDFHVFKFKTNDNDPTGTYTAKFTIGGEDFYKSLMVETIRPNRLNIDLSFVKGYVSASKNNVAQLAVSWLHGAAAANLNTNINMNLHPKKESFSKFKKYSFFNDTKKFTYDETTVFKGHTNDNGEITANIDLSNLHDMPGVMEAFFTTKVFENGGNFNINEQMVVFYPYKTFVGLRIAESDDYNYALPINDELTVDMVAVGRNGELTTDERSIEVAIYSLQSSWWYDFQDDEVDFLTANYNNAIMREKVTCKNGKVSLPISFDSDGYYIITAKDLKDGHTASLKVYAGSYADRNVARESMTHLNISTDKTNYDIGDKVKISFPANGGRALVSIENGTSVIDAFWVKPNNDNHIEVQFTATEAMSPNCYVNISMLHEHAETEYNTPIRMYGIVPVSVNNQQSLLKPVIDMPSELESESKVKVSISEENGRPMNYSIAIVDEGLLSLTNFATPDPWKHFYRKAALGVRTWDMFDNVVGAMAIDAGKLLSIGGGANAENINLQKHAIRFKPCVIFIGPFSLGKNKTQTHEIQLPQYVGAVRTMVVASYDNAFGSTELTTPVKKPVMAIAAAPRVIATGETFNLPVNIFAMDKNVKTVNVLVKTNDLVTLTSGAQKQLTFSKEGDKYVNFGMKAGSKPGIAKIEILAQSGNKTSKYDIELDVKYANKKTTRIIDGVCEDNDFGADFEAVGLAGTNTAVVELYSLPPMNLESRLNYLLTYPHGCLEQVVSSAFAQLYLNDVVELSGQDKKAAQKHVAQTLSLLQRYQTAAGGFAYWPGSDYVSEWATSYAGHFMLAAAKNGYAVNNDMKTKWLKYQKAKSTRWLNEGGNSEVNQAYRLYTLSLAGNADKSAMNRLKEVQTSTNAKWRLALAYAVAGKNNVANDIVNGLTTNIKPYTELDGTFGSQLRDKAMILETMTYLDQKNKAFELLHNISTSMNSDAYLSTQSTAFAIVAFAEFAKKYSANNGINCEINVNGKTFNAKTEKSALTQNIDIQEDTPNSITVHSVDGGMVYVKIVNSGIPEKGEEQASERNISLHVAYTDLKGNPIDVTKIPQGTDFVATIKVKNTSLYRTLPNVAITQIFPAGWEIINSRLFAAGSDNDSYCEYKDIRDDRIITYTSLSKEQTYVYRTMLSASFTGSYYLPAVVCETMYDNSNYANTKGLWVNVVDN